MNAVAVAHPQGQYNPAGITEVLYAFADDIATFPEAALPDDAMTFASLIELADDIVMKDGKVFAPLYCTLETGQVKCTLQGSRDGKGYMNSATISYPTNDANFLGFKAYSINRDLILLVKERNGKWRLIGDLENTVTIDSDEEDSGQKISDARKSVMTFSASSATPAKIYNGDTAGILVTT